MFRESDRSTYIFLFNVGRGLSAFIRTGLNHGFLIDMGKSDTFSPVDFIKDNLIGGLDEYDKQKIAQAVLSHPHADHISQCASLEAGVLHPSLLTCPHDKDDAPEDERINWSRLGGDDADKKELIASYKKLYEKRQLPLQTIQYKSSLSVPNLEYGLYFLRPGDCQVLHESDDNMYGNALSIVFYLRHGKHSILFPGDITPEAMAALLDEEKDSEKRYTVFDKGKTATNPTWHTATGSQPGLKDVLGSNGLTVLVAPHHGLESCFSEDLFDAISNKKPGINLISDKRKHADGGAGKIHPTYQSSEGAHGLSVTIDGKSETRRSLSTVNGHHILVIFSGSGLPVIYAEKDPMTLLDMIK